MNLVINIENIKPLSLNMCYTTIALGKSVRRFPSKEYKQVEEFINYQLLKHKKEIDKFNKFFDKTIHYLTVNYIFYFPILTVNKTINMRSSDLSNIVKPIEDIIFKNLTADDSHIVSMNVSKIHSDKIRFTVEINTHYIDGIL